MASGTQEPKSGTHRPSLSICIATISPPFYKRHSRFVLSLNFFYRVPHGSAHQFESHCMPVPCILLLRTPFSLIFSPCLEPGNLLQKGPMLGKNGECVYGTPDRRVVAIVATCCLVRAWLSTGRQWKTRYHCELGRNYFAMCLGALCWDDECLNKLIYTFKILITQWYKLNITRIQDQIRIRIGLNHTLEQTLVTKLHQSSANYHHSSIQRQLIPAIQPTNQTPPLNTSLTETLNSP